MSWITVGVTAAGALMGKAKNDAAQARQERTAKAAADAEAVSWARRDGRGSIPQVQYNQGDALSNVFQGGLSGFMMGRNINGAMGANAANAADAKTLFGDQVKQNPLTGGMDYSGLKGAQMDPYRRGGLNG